MKSFFTLHSSLFTYWNNRRQQKKALKARQQLLQTYALLEKIFDSGQLSFDPKSRRLFITQPLASLLMARGADAWINSIHTIYQYTYLRQSQKAWDEYMQREELTAVREAMQKAKSHEDGNNQSSMVNGPLGPMGRLRSGAEQESSMVRSTSGRSQGENGQSSMANSSLFTLHSSLTREDIDRIRLARRQQIAFSDMEPPKVEPFEFFIIPLSTEAKVEPLAVGYYDPNTGQMDVATWDDVRTLLSEASNNHESH